MPPTTASPGTKLAGGFVIDADAAAPALMEKIIDRALLTLVTAMTPGYVTIGGIERTKTGKERQQERTVLDALLRLMVNDLHLRTAEGNTEAAVEYGLAALAAVRGLVIKAGGPGPMYRPVAEHANWSLYDVMSDERKDRDYPGWRTRRGPRYYGGTPRRTP